MANNRPEEAAQGLISGVVPASTPVIQGPVTAGPQVADTAVFLIATGGPPPESFFGQDPQQYKTKRLQVRVRSSKNEFNSGRQMTQDVWDTLANAQPNGWTIFRMVNSDAIYLGRDAEDRHEWSINVQANIIE